MPHAPDAPRDFTVAFDDCLTARLTHCGLCGARALHGWRDATWTCDAPKAPLVALVVCGRCLRAPDWWARLDRRYRQRYDVEPHGEVQVTHEHRGAGPEETPH